MTRGTTYITADRSFWASLMSKWASVKAAHKFLRKHRNGSGIITACIPEFDYVRYCDTRQEAVSHTACNIFGWVKPSGHYVSIFVQ